MDEISSKKTDDSYVLAIPLYNGKMTLDLFEFLRGAGVTRVRRILKVIDEESWGDVRDKLLDEMESACGRLLDHDLKEAGKARKARVEEAKSELRDARSAVVKVKLARKRADEEGHRQLDFQLRKLDAEVDAVKDRLACALFDLRAISKGEVQVRKALEVIRGWRQK